MTKNKKVSISEIKLFKACRQAWYLKYHEHIEPVEKAENLETGVNYHSKLEDLYAGHLDTSDLSKESAMAKAYEKYIYPKFEVVSTEDWVIKNFDGSSFGMLGRTDGISNGALVEHKTTSETNLEEYEYGLQWDEQILAYMWLTGMRKMWYTIIRKPNIRQKKNESDEEFFNRMVAWYDEDTDTKIKLTEVFRTDEEVMAFAKHAEHIVSEIMKANNGLDDEIYRNTMYCTKWGRRCEYAGICLNYNPNEEYAGFVKDERRIDYGNRVDETESSGE